MDNPRAETLRWRIDVYRRSLCDAAEPTLISIYLSEIAKAELELAELEETILADARRLTGAPGDV